MTNRYYLAPKLWNSEPAGMTCITSSACNHRLALHTVNQEPSVLPLGSALASTKTGGHPPVTNVCTCTSAHVIDHLAFEGVVEWLSCEPDFCSVRAILYQNSNSYHGENKLHQDSRGKGSWIFFQYNYFKNIPPPPPPPPPPPQQLWTSNSFIVLTILDHLIH